MLVRSDNSSLDFIDFVILFVVAAPNLPPSGRREFGSLLSSPAPYVSRDKTEETEIERRKRQRSRPRRPIAAMKATHPDEIFRQLFLRRGVVEEEEARLRDIRSRWVSLMDDRVILDRKIAAVEDLAKQSVARLQQLQEEAAEEEEDEEKSEEEN